MTLSELPLGDVALIEQVKPGTHGQAFIDRLAAMGIIANREIKVLRRARLGGPLHIQVGATTEVAIRRREADSIVVCLAIV